ncbi:MAG: epoxyqueuosine reductase QueH, partial [Lentisphaeria bacterium]|nr:epoxyqueuosine reductase QueH [Lentisphaeria bacterium]
FSPWDVKKQDGFLKGYRKAKELELYRQSYCGCEFSLRG